MTKEMLIKKLKMALDNIGDEEVLNQLNTIKNIIYKDNTTQNWDTINTILDMTFQCFQSYELPDTGIFYRLNYNTDQYEIIKNNGDILKYNKDQSDKFVRKLEKLYGDNYLDFIELEFQLKLGHLCSSFPSMNGKYIDNITMSVRQYIMTKDKNYKDLIVGDKGYIVISFCHNADDIENTKKFILDHEDSARKVMYYMIRYAVFNMSSGAFKAMINMLERRNKSIVAA